MTRLYMAFKAGRAFRRPGTNFVDAKPEKGAIYLEEEDDEMLHLKWKNRTTGEFEEDLVMVPGDATFLRVPECAGARMYVLKFASSTARYFFWMQAGSSRRDRNFVSNLNRVLRDPDQVPVWDSRLVRPGEGEGDSGPSTSPAAASTSAPVAPTAGGSGAQPTSEQLAQLRSLVASMAGNTGAGSGQPELSLTDILTPATLGPLFTAHPELIPALFPHLPPDLPSPPSAEALQRIVASPQFRGAVASFDRALRTGMLGGLVRSLGLPEEAGTGVEPFLRAVAEQAREGSRSGAEGGESMDTD